jgi:hypothetical protein
MFHLGGHGEHHRANLIAGGAEGIGGLQFVAGVMTALAARALARLDLELAVHRRDHNVRLELRVCLFFSELALAIGARVNGHGDDLIDVLGFGTIGGGMVFGPTGRFRRAVLELIVGFAEGMSGAFVVAFLLGEFFLEDIALSARLLELQFEFSDLLDVQGALRARCRGHSHSSKRAEKTVC